MSVLNVQREVLRCFKTLHKTRKLVFNDDKYALELARKQINEEFKKNKDVGNTTEIEQLIKYSLEVEAELRTTVIQAKEIKPGLFEAKIRPETVRVTNVPYKDIL